MIIQLVRFLKDVILKIFNLVGTNDIDLKNFIDAINQPISAGWMKVVEKTDFTIQKKKVIILNQIIFLGFFK